MALNSDFTNIGPWDILERESDVVFTNVGTGTEYPVGKTIGSIVYETGRVRPVLQGSPLGQLNFPAISNINSITDANGNPLGFADMNEYSLSLSTVLMAGGGDGTSVVVINNYWENGTNAAVTVNGGATYVTLGAAACRLVTMWNTIPSGVNAAVDLEVRYGSGTAVVLPAGSFASFPVNANANELSVRRFDQSASAVTVNYIYYTPSV